MKPKQFVLFAIRVKLLMLQITLCNVHLEIRIWQPNLCLKWSGVQVSTYFCPRLCGTGDTKLSRYIHWWGQRSAYYRSGFVFRFLWFGFILRYGRVLVRRKKSLDEMVRDWVPDDAAEYEAERLLALTDLDEADAF